MATHDFRPGSPHVINRATLFDDIISLYTKELLEVVVEYPICMCLEDEMAVDAGGVARDVFSQFFSEAYLHLFDGSSLLYPAVHASVSMATFPTLGAITSHAYLATGVFPDRVAFPCLAAALLGHDIVISDIILEESFVSCLSTHEASILRNALSLKEYSPRIQLEVVDVLSGYGCRGAPQPSNLRKSIAEAARYTFLVKPAAALSMMNAGIPQTHKSFWKAMSVEKLHSLYLSLSVSVDKVLSILQEPIMRNHSEEEVWQYLRRFVGNMTVDELRTFLRFVTGSFVISVPSISVSFNTLDGLARRPISHTCSALLELPSTYTSLPIFVSEFRAILADDLYSWRMDAL